MNIVMEYVLPNVVLFGGLYGIAKAAEAGAWYFICNYDQIINRLVNWNNGV